MAEPVIVEQSRSLPVKVEDAFHGTLMQLADQRWLYQVWRSQEWLLGPLLVTIGGDRPTNGELQADRHLELVAAAETGDRDLFAEACLRHHYLPARASGDDMGSPLTG